MRSPPHTALARVSGGLGTIGLLRPPLRPVQMFNKELPSCVTAWAAPAGALPSPLPWHAHPRVLATYVRPRRALPARGESESDARLSTPPLPKGTQRTHTGTEERVTRTHAEQCSDHSSGEGAKKAVVSDTSDQTKAGLGVRVVALQSCSEARRPLVVIQGQLVGSST